MPQSPSPRAPGCGSIDPPGLARGRHVLRRHGPETMGQLWAHRGALGLTFAVDAWAGAGELCGEGATNTSVLAAAQMRTMSLEM